MPVGFLIRGQGPAPGSLGHLVGARYGGGFPLGTFLINVTGCFALGLLTSMLAALHRDTALLTAVLATGFLGGYTTFSTFSLESVRLLQAGAARTALTYVTTSLVTWLVSVWLGHALASGLNRLKGSS